MYGFRGRTQKCTKLFFNRHLFTHPFIEVVWTFLTKIWFGVWALPDSIFTFLFGRFLTFHRSCSSLHSLFKAKNASKIKANPEPHKSSDDISTFQRLQVPSSPFPSHLTPYDVSAHTIWHERSHHMMWALTSYGVRWLSRRFVKTLVAAKNNLVQNAKQICTWRHRSRRV